MAKFYGQVEGMAQTVATRRGGEYIRSSAQSWDGSVTVRLDYDDNEVLKVELNLCKGSGMGGDYDLPRFYGTMDELIEMINVWNNKEYSDIGEQLQQTISPIVYKDALRN